MYFLSHNLKLIFHVLKHTSHDLKLIFHVLKYKFLPVESYFPKPS